MIGVEGEPIMDETDTDTSEDGGDVDFGSTGGVDSSIGAHFDPSALEALNRSIAREETESSTLQELGQEYSTVLQRIDTAGRRDRNLLEVRKGDIEESFNVAGRRIFDEVFGVQRDDVGVVYPQYREEFPSILLDYARGAGTREDLDRFYGEVASVLGMWQEVPSAGRSDFVSEVDSALSGKPIEEEERPPAEAAPPPPPPPPPSAVEVPEEPTPPTPTPTPSPPPPEEVTEVGVSERSLSEMAQQYVADERRRAEIVARIRGGEEISPEEATELHEIEEHMGEVMLQFTRRADSAFDETFGVPSEYRDQEELYLFLIDKKGALPRLSIAVESGEQSAAALETFYRGIYSRVASSGRVPEREVDEFVADLTGRPIEGEPPEVTVTPPAPPPTPAIPRPEPMRESEFANLAERDRLLARIAGGALSPETAQRLLDDLYDLDTNLSAASAAVRRRQIPKGVEAWTRRAERYSPMLIAGGAAAIDAASMVDPVFLGLAAGAIGAGLKYSQALEEAKEDPRSAYRSAIIERDKKNIAGRVLGTPRAWAVEHGYGLRGEERRVYNILQSVGIEIDNHGSILVVEADNYRTEADKEALFARLGSIHLSNLDTLIRSLAIRGELADFYTRGRGLSEEDRAAIQSAQAEIFVTACAIRPEESEITLEALLNSSLEEAQRRAEGSAKWQALEYGVATAAKSFAGYKLADFAISRYGDIYRFVDQKTSFGIPHLKETGKPYVATYLVSAGALLGLAPKVERWLAEKKGEEEIIERREPPEGQPETQQDALGSAEESMIRHINSMEVPGDAQEGQFVQVFDDLYIQVGVDDEGNIELRRKRDEEGNLLLLDTIYRIREVDGRRFYKEIQRGELNSSLYAIMGRAPFPGQPEVVEAEREEEVEPTPPTPAPTPVAPVAIEEEVEAESREVRGEEIINNPEAYYEALSRIVRPPTNFYLNEMSQGNFEGGQEALDSFLGFLVRFTDSGTHRNIVTELSEDPDRLVGIPEETQEDREARVRHQRRIFRELANKLLSEENEEVLTDSLSRLGAQDRIDEVKEMLGNYI